MTQIKKQVEALLFSSGRYMKVADLAIIMNLKEKDVKSALNELKKDYDERDSSLMIVQEGDSWKLNIREQYISLVTKIVADTELSKTVVETLGVIAWKHPALQSDIIKIRSSQAYDHIKELVDLGFIRKEREGRSYLLRLTEKFFEYFDVPGEKAIKDVLKEVKIPKKEDKQLGSLEVVPITDTSSKSDKSELEIANEEMKKKFEVVDEPEPKVEVPPVDNEFLKKIDKNIDDISKLNDELDNDDLFKRKQPDEEGISKDETSSQDTDLGVLQEDNQIADGTSENNLDEEKVSENNDKSKTLDSNSRMEEIFNDESNSLDEKNDEDEHIKDDAKSDELAEDKNTEEGVVEDEDTEEETNFVAEDNAVADDISEGKVGEDKQVIDSDEEVDEPKSEKNVSS